jgi:FMN-dependent NADH-azoreductase
MRLLHIDSSITGPASVSRQLTTRVVDHYRAATPDLTIDRRDLEAVPLPHLDGKSFAASFGGGTVDAAIRQERDASAKALEEFLGADVVVIGAPMYNFTISSQLKSWIDRIVVAGKTFRYTENGPEGLAGNKKIIIVSTRGGFYGPGTARAALDFQETFLRAVFQFIGVTDIQFLRAEGIAMGPDQRETALTQALEAVPAIATPVVRSRPAVPAE